MHCMYTELVVYRGPEHMPLRGAAVQVHQANMQRRLVLRRLPVVMVRQHGDLRIRPVVEIMV